MLLPGISGPVVTLPRLDEPLADALLYEQVPYRSAMANGATHCLVLRSRPDGVEVMSKISILERMMLRRFWRRKNKLPEIHRHMKMQRHRVLYGQGGCTCVCVCARARTHLCSYTETEKTNQCTNNQRKDMVRLNMAAGGDALNLEDLSPSGARDGRNGNGVRAGGGEGPRPSKSAHVATVALPDGCPEVGRLERTREVILDGVHFGFAQTAAFFDGDLHKTQGSLNASEHMRLARELLA